MTLSWQSGAPATGPNILFDVTRGNRSSTSDNCYQSGFSRTCTTDRATPVPGDGFRYLVRGTNVCGQGTYGFKSDRNERPATSCP